MVQRRRIAAVYAAAVVQGIVLVTFPAVSAIFTSQAHYGLSTTEYGGMFIPQAITAVLSSLLGAGLGHRLGGKRVLQMGLASDLLSMLLLFSSQFATDRHALAYGILLAATGCLGIGFGFAVPALNTFTAAFFPQKIDTAILTLNALLGLGTALAPLFALLFVGLGFWWGLPILMSVLTLGLILFSLSLPLQDPIAAHRTKEEILAKSKMPARFWLYAAFALIYGVCETMNANWASVYLIGTLGASATLASIALTTFWIAVTAGRLLFAVLEKWCPPPWVYRLLPLVLAFAFSALAWAPGAHPSVAILFFGIAGLGCSALLPLVISFGQKELVSMSAAVAGGLIGFYQMGYGIAAFGVGPLEQANLSLGTIYGATGLLALGLTALAFAIIGRPAAQITST